MTAEVVEQVLITDEWSCDQCGFSKVAVCPLSGKPHRRRLVRIAQDILRLVGRRVGKSYVRSARLAERVDGKVRVRTERHIAVNPQLLLLAFYFSASGGERGEREGLHAHPSAQSTGFLAECARHLLDLLQQVESYGRRVPSEMDERYAKTLLQSFYSAWKEYLKHASGEVAADDRKTEERVSADELYNATRSALLAAAREAVRDPTNADLKTFAALLYQRVVRLATKEQLTAVKDDLDRIEQQKSPRYSPTTPSLTPEQHSSLDPVHSTTADAAPPSVSGSSAPPTDDTAAAAAAAALYNEAPTVEYSSPPLLPSDLNTTSGSEVDALPPAAAAHALGHAQGKPLLGPELPPDWHVDETGRSRPKPGHEERKKREKYLQLEFRARKSHEAIMSVEPAKSDTEMAQEAVVAAVGESQLEELRQQLNQPKPRYAMIPELLRAVEGALVEALPRRFRHQLEQEFRDVLDWNVIVRRSTNGHAALSNVLQFVMHKVILYGAPEREAETRAETERVSKDLDNLNPDLGTAVANAFRFLFASVKALRADVAKYSLLLVANQLRHNALEYIRAFIDTCLPRPAQWASSITFLKGFVNAELVRGWMTSSEATSMVLLSEPERRVRGALLFGLVELLRSGTHTPADRWDQLPAEIFYFEKPYIFTAANAVQECTLLLLLEGTVSTILSSKRCTHAQVADTLKRLHHHILRLLSQDIKLDALKEAVTDFLDNALETLLSVDVTKALPHAALLSESDRRVVCATIDKMTNTAGPLYVSFESKVVQFMTRVICKEPNPAPLGLVTETATRQATLIQKLLAFHWEVYRPFYQSLMPLLDMEP